MKEPDRRIVKEVRDDEVRAILKTFESVWTISMTVIFYYTDAQVKENLANGTSAKIIEALRHVRDASYSFDSKETFDRDYESKWHYYWK